MAFIDDKSRGQLTDIFGKMEKEVHIIYAKGDDANSKDGELYLKEIAEIAPKLTLLTLTAATDGDELEDLGLSMFPGVLVTDPDYRQRGLVYYGIPAGHEVNSLVLDILAVSGFKQELPDDVMEKIKGIDNDVTIKVFVTLTCPYCPGAVGTAHRLALENPKIRGEMIDSGLFPELADSYKVQGVPKIVINDEKELIGNQPLDNFLEAISQLS